ncbi:MAG: hypothetical protein QM682_00975 [Paracoccus sp. (in: a-proteobacteria)]|uniref:hypothetical protein n=1 Tax=Paracoccus sp. TaxID=267 RepID=UPI0039E5F068
MQHERIWQQDRQAPAESAGNVLSSIRKLISQDQARLPGEGGMAEAQPRAGAQQVLSPGDHSHAPLLLGREDLIDAVAPIIPMPVAEPAAHDIPCPHPANAPSLGIVEREGARQAPAQPPAIDPAPQPAIWPSTTAEVWFNSPEALQDRATPSSDETLLSPEEETEFAEAEAALAKMIASRPAEASRTAEKVTAPQGTLPVEKEVMAQDMRMTDMGRIEDIAALRPSARAIGLGGMTAAGGAAPNLFGEIGGVAKDATLRVLIRDAIQQELHGELGQRLSRNMCQMIRQEVEAVIREICAES